MATRTLEVSTDVFAAIWADRQEGEESENDILRRKFGVPTKPPSGERRQAWCDARNNVVLFEGDEVFRVYKGKERKAVAKDGWLVMDNTKFTSLNQLSRHIGAATENAWQNWYTRDAKGERVLMNSLRN